MDHRAGQLVCERTSCVVETHFTQKAEAPSLSARHLWLRSQYDGESTEAQPLGPVLNMYILYTIL